MRYYFRHILSLVLLFLTLPLFAQTEAELKKRKANTEKEIANIDSQLSANNRAKKTKTAQITLLNNRIEQRKKLIRDTDIQISVVEKEIKQKSNDVNEIKSYLSRLKDAYSELLVNIYTKRKKATWLMYVFASEDISQAYRRLRYLQSYTDVVFVQADKITKTTTQLSTEISSLSDKKQELNAYKDERKLDVDRLAKDEEEAKKMLDGLKGEEAKLKKQLQQKRTVLAKLNTEIANNVAKEIKKTKTEGYTKTPENVKLSNNFIANRGRLPWPVKQGKIARLFGQHNHPVFKHIQLPPNNGIDISTDENENVLAVFDGVVSTIFSLPGMNNCVMLKHGEEYFTVYCKLSVISVKVGDSTKTGTVLGKVFASDEDSQLHFELWKGMTKLDPQLWLLKK